jgi:hypothetical protein
MRTRISELSALPDGPVVVAGWVDTVRDQKGGSVRHFA